VEWASGMAFSLNMRSPSDAVGHWLGRHSVGGGIRGLSGGVIKTEGGKKRVLTILRICLIARRYGGSSGRNHTSAGRLVWLLSGHRSRVAEGGESLIAGNC